MNTETNSLMPKENETSKIYSSPQLTEYGSLAEITRMIGMNNKANPDGGSGMGNPDKTF
ncbi:MAG: lasso RiPP family leader peptide-containing protein [Blastocatellales bacterium]